MATQEDLLRQNAELLEKLKQLELEKRQSELEKKELESEKRQSELEKRQLELEKKELELGKKQIEEKSCFGYIIKKGLPELGPGPLETDPSVTQKKSVPYEVVQDQVDFPIMEDLDLDESQPSLVWQRCQNSEWLHETSIRNTVELAISDIINACQLGSTLAALPEVTFVGLDPKHPDRTDIALGRRGHMRPIVGAIEVKKPPNQAQREKQIKFNMNDCGQIVQYLYDLRACHGVRFVMGILTTYEEWRFVWFEDSHEAVMSVLSQKYGSMCTKSPENTPVESPVEEGTNDGLASIPEKVRIIRSKIYRYDDVSLIPKIASACFKWSLTPWDKVLGFFHPKRMYQTIKLDSKEVGYRTLPKVTFTYQFPPHGATKYYYILRVYRRTGDGKVALWCTENGNLGVLKFCFDDDDDGKRNAEREAQGWKELWGISVLVKKVLGNYCVFMPFVFHIRRYVDGLRFCPVQAWNHKFDQPSWEDLFGCDVTEDSELKQDPKVKMFFEDKFKVAEEALKVMHKKGKILPDEELKWEHVGLLPVPGAKKGAWTVKPVIFDLTRLTEIKTHQKAVSLSHQLSLLNALFPQ